MKVLNIFFLFLFFSPILLFAQNSNDFGIKFSGFVKTDVIFDSRQTVNIREGHFLLYPSPVTYDKDSIDVNAVSNFNILSIQSRLAGTITGPDVFSANTSAYFEGEFFGLSDADINGFRLRHAWIKFIWKNRELLVGQYWHPLFITESFPEVISFNTGAPFHPFSRNPQIRFTQKSGSLCLIATACSQRDFVSPGGSFSLRNAVLPDLNIKVQNTFTNTSKTIELLAGASADFKMLMPRLISNQFFQTKQKVKGIIFDAFLKLKTPGFTLKLESTFGQNMFDLTMLGGYAYRYTSDTDIINKDIFEYTTIDNFSAWTELMSNGLKFQYGIFAGYSKNLGSLHNIYNWFQLPAFNTTRGANIDYLYRISPRIVFNSGKFRFGAEIEYTVAAYGAYSKIDSLGVVHEAEEVGNIRALLGVFYFF